MDSLELLNKHLSNKNLVKHCLAVKAIMEGLAEHFGEDKEKWGTAGLLHDIDYEQTKDSPTGHSMIGAKMLLELGYAEDICQAVKTHNEAHGIAPETLMEKSLYVADPLSGLIAASALVLPSKKMADLEKQNILNRFDEKAFAKGANRMIIAKCQELLNLNLAEFVDIALNAMKKVSGELGL